MSTVTIKNYSGNFDATIYFTNDAPEYIYTNGTFTYSDTVEYIWWTNMDDYTSGEYYPPDKENVFFNFKTLSGEEEEATVWDPTYPNASSQLCGRVTFVGDNASVRPTSITGAVFEQGNESGSAMITVKGISTYYTIYHSGSWSDGDLSFEFPNIPNYTLTTNPENSTYKFAKDATYRYTGTLPSTSRSTTEAKPYIYIGGAWKLADEKIWLSEWKEGVFHVLRAAGAIEEEQNAYGTTAIISNYTTEQNSHGTTVVIE